MRAIALMCLTIAVVSALPDEAALLPKANLTGTQSVTEHLFGPKLAPGGVIGKYKDAKGTYELLLARLPSNDKAAYALLDIKKVMVEAHYLAHMGGFAGTMNGQPFYIFAKGRFLAAVRGRPELQADQLARVLAAKLPAP